MVKKSAIAGGALLGASAALFCAVLLKKKEIVSKRYSLTIEATTGGTTSPPPGTYAGDSPATVSITAIPSSGYEFDGWYLSGEKVSAELTYSFEVTGNVLLIASFLKVGAPVLIPAYIKPVEASISVVQWWKARVSTEVATFTLHLEVSYSISGHARFRICDAAGNGVPNQRVALYTDPNPDELGFGFVCLNDNAGRYRDSPLILTSDGNGEVFANIDYKWIEPNSDYRNTIGTFGRVRCKCPILFGYNYWWKGPPVQDGYYINKPCAFCKLERLKHPILRNINYIRAFWVDNPNLMVTGDIAADCMIKIEDKLYGHVEP